jgi:hypothetical protein
MPKFLIVTESVPNIYLGGGGITAISVILALRREGHTVTVVSLYKSIINHTGHSDMDYIRELNSHGVKVEVIGFDSKQKDVSYFRKLFPRKQDVFPGYNNCVFIESVIKRIEPDAIFAYHWNSIASISNSNIPKLGIVGDPIHLPYLFRKEYSRRVFGSKYNLINLKNWVLEKTQIPRKKRFIDQLLEACNSSGAFAAHHAKEFMDRGIYNCRYYRTPVIDPLKNVESISKPDKFKIMHIGHLQGIASMAGVEILAFEILPELDKLIGSNNYELHLVGGFFETLPDSIRTKLLSYPSLKVRGQISPPDEEFLTSHVLLVPTPIELGIRVRIITGFSFGSCVITHKANTKGIPELVNGANSIIGDDGISLAQGCYEVYRNVANRRKLEFASRETYKKYFSLESAGKEISNTLKSLLNEY